ncbi:MAG: nucleotide exchange factor GrpE [Sandaracinaceae bacterium]|nr:nucleotide exchange factor GrpE [Sandaracinaceae bacterium]
MSDEAPPDEKLEAADEAAPADAAPAEPDPSALLREERDKYRDQLLRTAADFDNFRKRTRKDLEEAERRGKEDVIREVLPVLDNLERALGAAAALPADAGAAEVKGIVDGVKMVLKLFEDQAGRMGLSRVKTVGERFDPSVHDAIQQVETDEQAPGTVIQEVVAGYRLGEKLVRPAMVVVARKPAASA